MPELPDLQVFSKNLSRHLKGKKVSSVVLRNSKKANVSEKEFNKQLIGQSVENVYREGKEIYIQFRNKAIVGLHMMLRGQLSFFEGSNDKRFPIVEIHFRDKTGLAMSDYQGQATPTLNPVPRDSPDALSKDVNFKFLKTRFQKSKAAVKNLLLDQDFIRGIGNAYADEILWAAKISPFSAANQIPDAYVKTLAKAIKSVLTAAEKSILKSNPDIIGGEVRDFLKIHNSKKDKSPSGAKIIHKVAGSRKTYYTTEQQLFE
jgi:formamidopyrimidine-DNA glycosylase